ncbi:MAG: hypothetical protein R3E32_13245 [Chitinophagales bacterium]
MSNIIVCKGQNFVQLQVAKLRQKEELQSLTWQKNGKTCTAYFTSDLILNGSHTDIKTNYFEYEQVDNKTNEIVFRGSWITDLPIDKKNLAELVAVARARWKIENEVFNTLKNQGYHLEHNYGHGHKYLATNFALLTFLAFFVDQIVQHLDIFFQKAKSKCSSFASLWEKVRAIFYLVPVVSMEAIYKFIVEEKQLDIPPLE